MQCKDEKCPAHGHLKVRGNLFSGKVKSAKSHRTASVERTLVKYVPKYERYKKTKSRIYAHNPDCIAAEEGDTVTVGETRKLSKTKSFVVLKILKKEKKHEHKEEKKEHSHEKKEHKHGKKDSEEKEHEHKHEKKEDEKK